VLYNRPFSPAHLTYHVLLTASLKQIKMHGRVFPQVLH